MLSGGIDVEVSDVHGFRRHLVRPLLLGTLAPLLIGALIWGAWLLMRPAPRAALVAVGDQKTEDTRLDPLILAGEPASAYVLSELRNRALVNRGDAIGYLGNQRYAPAAAALQSIVLDRTEPIEARAAGLEALAQIDERRGRTLAATIGVSSSALGVAADRVLAGALPPRRTFWQAFVGCHDC